MRVRGYLQTRAWKGVRIGWDRSLGDVLRSRDELLFLYPVDGYVLPTAPSTPQQQSTRSSCIARPYTE
jgi:hypothetical protein